MKPLLILFISILNTAPALAFDRCQIRYTDRNGEERADEISLKNDADFKLLNFEFANDVNLVFNAKPTHVPRSDKPLFPHEKDTYVILALNAKTEERISSAKLMRNSPYFFYSVGTVAEIECGDLSEIQRDAVPRT